MTHFRVFRPLLSADIERKAEVLLRRCAMPLVSSQAARHSGSIYFGFSWSYSPVVIKIHLSCGIRPGTSYLQRRSAMHDLL